MKNIIKLQFRAFCFIFPLLFIFSCPLVASEDVTIGVLANRGRENALTSWQPLADYLSREIPDHIFKIQPIDFKEVFDVARDGKVDFILVNSGLYVQLEYNYGVRPIATLRARHGDSGISLFAGLIITRADRTDVRSFSDLKGKHFMAVDPDSLGGWLMAKRELMIQGIDPDRDFATLDFVGTHDGVVKEILSGKVDAGAVRFDTLGHMVEEHLIDLGTIRVIQGDRPKSNLNIIEKEFPFPHSTDIYPEWPMAKLLGTPDNLATKVAIALLKMSSQEEAAKRANIMGWDIARNYQPVHELYRELRLGPYRVIKNLRAIDVWQNYWPIIMSASAFLSIICIMLFILLHLRGRLVKANKEITHMAMHDPLTLLPNRRMFRFLAESAFAQAKREGWLVFFLLIDLDGFKAVNDTYGHESGDEVLRQVSRRLRHVMPNFNCNKDIPHNFSSIEERKNADGSFRAEDHIARHGGDEFLSLLIHVTQKAHAEAIAQRIIDTIQHPIDIGGTQVSVGASIGISVFPNDGENFEELARTADLAMYDVKISGKGTYKFYRKDLD